MSFEIRNGLLLKYDTQGDNMSPVIPEDVTGIGQHAFERSDIESIDVPEGVSKVESMAFSGCIDLKEAKLPASLTAVYSYAFADCVSLETVTIPDELFHYGEHIFFGAKSLRQLSSATSDAVLTYDAAERSAVLECTGRGQNVILAGLLLDAGITDMSMPVTCRDRGDGSVKWALWVPLSETSDELKGKIRDGFYTTSPFDFRAFDDLFRSMKDRKNRLYYALLRILYPISLEEEYDIMFRNHVRRYADVCVRYLINDGRIDWLRLAAGAGLLDSADIQTLIEFARDRGSDDAAAVLKALDRGGDTGDAGIETLTPSQIKALNNPVFKRLMERKEKLRRASMERLAAAGEGNLVQMLRDGVRADNRNQVRYLLGGSAGAFDRATLFECALLAIDNDDSYMLQDIIEAMPSLSPDSAGRLLEHAAIGGQTDVVKFICFFVPEISGYNRALGYAMRRADFEMASAILNRKDQSLKTAEEIKNSYVKLMSGPEVFKLDRRIVDLGYVDYNYYDDDFRYMLQNTNRNGLIADQFYDTHYVLVRLAGAEERLAFIKQMYDGGYFTMDDLRYICYLATDADEIPVAQGLVDMGVDDFDVKRCSVRANQQTLSEDLGDLFTGNPKRPSDEKFDFIISRLKPGEKLMMKVQYLLKSADVARALEILKHSSLECCEDVPQTIEYFVRHNSVEAIELFCSWGREDECFETAQTLENTEIVAWILNYKNTHNTRTDIEDRFAL